MRDIRSGWVCGLDIYKVIRGGEIAAKQRLIKILYIILNFENIRIFITPKK